MTLPMDLRVTSGLLGLDPDEVDRRIADGWTLPATLFTDPAVDELEDAVIWRPAWQNVGTMADFRRPGDYLTVQLGKYPVLITLDRDEQLRAFLNVCRHRGALVAGGDTGAVSDGGSGNCSRFKCRYHAWTYGLDGRLLGAPDTKGESLPPFEELGLYPVSVDTWAGIVFVSIEPKESLAEYLSGGADLAAANNYRRPFESGDLAFAQQLSYEIPCNWKVFMENNIECYHCATTHSESVCKLLRVDHENFCNINFRNGGWEATRFTDDIGDFIGDDAAKQLQDATDAYGELPFQQYWVWPANTFTTGTAIGDMIVRIDPLGPDRCRLLWRFYLSPDAPLEKERLDEFQRNVLPEDIGVSSGVQIGLKSGARQWGPLLQAREESVRWFEQQVWEHLGPAIRDLQARAGR